MPTELLYLKDSYQYEFSATITQVDASSKAVILDKTAFYPTGGGQPHDRGFLTVDGMDYLVLEVKKRGGDVLHCLEYLPSSEVIEGKTCLGKVDAELRMKYSRTHTALHILCGVIYHEFGSTVTGGQIKALEGRMDFDIDAFRKDRVSAIEEKCNEAIERELPIKIAFLEREEADKDPDLIRTKVSLIPPSVRVIRTVDIEGLDKQADGGTHVRNTKEVGRIRITKISNRGKGRKRLYITVEDPE